MFCTLSLWSFSLALLKETHTKKRDVLTLTVVSIVGQHESVVAGASVVARYVDALMHAAPIVVVLTLVHV